MQKEFEILPAKKLSRKQRQEFLGIVSKFRAQIFGLSFVPSDFVSLRTNCFVALKGGVPVGYVVFSNFSISPSEIYLSEMYVKPEFEHKGIARLLVSNVLSKFKKKFPQRQIRISWTRVNEKRKFSEIKYFRPRKPLKRIPR